MVFSHVRVERVSDGVSTAGFFSGSHPAYSLGYEPSFVWVCVDAFDYERRGKKGYPIFDDDTFIHETGHLLGLKHS